MAHGRKISLELTANYIGKQGPTAENNHNKGLVNDQRQIEFHYSGNHFRVMWK